MERSAAHSCPVVLGTNGLVYKGLNRGEHSVRVVGYMLSNPLVPVFEGLVEWENKGRCLAGFILAGVRVRGSTATLSIYYGPAGSSYVCRLDRGTREGEWEECKWCV